MQMETNKCWHTCYLVAFTWKIIHVRNTRMKRLLNCVQFNSVRKFSCKIWHIFENYTRIRCRIWGGRIGAFEAVGSEHLLRTGQTWGGEINNYEKKYEHYLHWLSVTNIVNNHPIFPGRVFQSLLSQNMQK